MNKKELLAYCKRYAKEKMIRLNPDRTIVDHILEGLLAREKQFGHRFCPCRRITGDPDEDERIICPCAYHLQEIKEDGHCKCLLFVSP